MDVIIKLRNRLECKINYTLLVLLPNKLNIMRQGLATSGENIRNKRVIPTLAIIQGVAAIGGMMIKGVNTLVDAKRASSFNNAIKLVNENVQITHDRLITLENRTAMMAKAIIPYWKTLKKLCAKIGYMYYCEYAYLLKKCTEHTSMSAIYYDQGSDVKARQCKTIITFDTIVESRILDAGNLLILSNLQKPWTIACKDVSRVFEIEYSTYRILNR